MYSAFSQTDHRPWPCPGAPWSWRQSWDDLLFVHFEAHSADLRRLVPSWLELELFDGKAWLGIVPFRMTGVTRRGWPAPSLLCDFPEINVRTYVSCGGKPGVWFFSLDAMTFPGVWFARTFFHLPYNYAPITLKSSGPAFAYSSRHAEREFTANYWATPDPVDCKPGDFAHWATERYCLYAQSRAGRRFRAEVQHPKWPLQKAGLQITKNTISPVVLGDIHPLVLFSRHLDVAVWPLTEID